MRADTAQSILNFARSKPLPGFLRWLRLLQRCYPLPDCAIALMLGVKPDHVNKWKSRYRNPCRPAVTAMRFLVYLRIGGPLDERWYFHPPSFKTLERVVEEYLEAEEAELARMEREKEKRETRKAKR